MSDWVKQERSVSGPGDDWIKAEREHEIQMAHFKADQEKAERQQRRFVMEQPLTSPIHFLLRSLSPSYLPLTITPLTYTSLPFPSSSSPIPSLPHSLPFALPSLFPLYL